MSHVIKRCVSRVIRGRDPYIEQHSKRDDSKNKEKEEKGNKKKKRMPKDSSSPTN